MVKPLQRKLWRDIRRHRPQFIAITITIFLGVAIFGAAWDSYSNLVAFAETEDLKHILFITSRPTQKYRNLSHNPRVSMLIDSRSNAEADFHDAVAVSVAVAVGSIVGVAVSETSSASTEIEIGSPTTGASSPAASSA